MAEHITRDGAALACTTERLGTCRVCDLITPGSPAYREDYRRLFHPAEFPGDPPPDVAPDPTPWPAPPPPSFRPGGPGLIRKAANFGRAIVSHAVAGFPGADDETVTKRLNICHECEFYSVENRTCLHQKCGCVLDIKVRWKDQSCPAGKW